MKNSNCLFINILISGIALFFYNFSFGQSNIRPAGKCGIPFYPQNTSELKTKMDKYFSSVEKKYNPAPNEFPIGIISPHAGYDYAGIIMATGYQYIKGSNIKRIILLGFSHRYPINGVDVGDWDSVSTPLGNLDVDKELVSELLKNKVFSKGAKSAQDIEWSTENQLPFIKYILPDVKIVILLVEDLNKAELEQAASVLKKYIDDDTAFVISSDFTHYGHNYGYIPFTKNIKENLYKLDGDAADLIARKDLTGFDKYINETQATICGRNPIRLFMKIIEKENINGTRLAYMTSGDLESDYEMGSVGYASILFTKNKSEKNSGIKDNEKNSEVKEMSKEDLQKKRIREQLFGTDNEPDTPVLSSEEKKTLMAISRDMLDNCTKNPKYHPDFKKYNITDNLKIPCRVFVTLKMDGDLRGCIGFSHAELPLAEAVVKSTYNSCYEDPRFSNVRPEEAKKIHIDISVNTPPRLAPNGYKDIELGKHGIYLVNWTGGMPSVATFLPMVAAEQGWDISQTLTHLSRKAGLSANAWKDPETEFYLYTSQIIDEKEYK